MSYVWYGRGFHGLTAWAFRDTLMLLPSVAVRLEDGTLAAWAFLALDGTLSTLHCEEPYRRRGIGGAVATRVLRDYGSRFEGGDGWYAADVTVGNVQSQALCESLGGKLAWNMSWWVWNLPPLSHGHTTGLLTSRK